MVTAHPNSIAPRLTFHVHSTFRSVGVLRLTSTCLASAGVHLMMATARLTRAT